MQTYRELLQEALGYLGHPAAEHSFATSEAIKELKDKIEKHLDTSVLTFGQKAVGLSFNHGEGEIFKQIQNAKLTCAEAIDQMNELRSMSESGEYKALSTISIRATQGAQMDMVKAITWKD